VLAAPTRTDTRTAVLASARRLFARRGYDGTSIRAITADAGANLGAVTYHFGSKQALYFEVLDQVLAPLPPRVAAAIAGADSPLDKVDSVVRAFFDHLHENPDQPFLILQEIAAGKPPPPPVRHVMMSTLSAVVRVIEEGQASGTIRPGDPLMFVLSMLSQPVYLSLARRAFQGDGSPDWQDPTVQSAVVEHSVAFVRAGLATFPQEGSHSS